MEYTLNMVFNTAQGKKVTFSISGVKSTITEVQANAVMSAILAKNIFTTSSGDFVSKDSMTLVSRQETIFTVA